MEMFFKLEQYFQMLVKTMETDNFSWAENKSEMRGSPAYEDLTDMQQVLLTYCLIQCLAGFVDNPFSKEFIELEDTEYPVRRFHFNRQVWKELNLYSDKESKKFYADMAALVEHGFVVCIKSGWETKTKSVYALVDRWRLWGTPEFEIPQEYMTVTMKNKRKRQQESQVV